MRLALATALALWPAICAAQTTWDDLKAELYPGRTVQDGSDVISLDLPYRTPDDTRTQIAALATAPAGLRLGQLTIVLDENPMPVSARFDMDRAPERVFAEVTMRVNGPTPVHVVAETTDGQLFMVEGFVKTSGTGACAAPPGTDPEAALATLGDMTLELGSVPGLPALLNEDRTLDIALSHPSLSGLQKDQVSLLFIPMRYVHRLEVEVNGDPWATMIGSISLSENPEVRLSVPATTQVADVTMTDTDDTVARANRDFPSY